MCFIRRILNNFKLHKLKLTKKKSIYKFIYIYITCKERKREKKIKLLYTYKFIRKKNQISYVKIKTIKNIYI